MFFDADDPCGREAQAEPAGKPRLSVNEDGAEASPSDGDNSAAHAPEAGSESAPANFDEMLSRLKAIPQPGRRICEMKSALRRMRDALRKPLHEIPTDPQKLRKLLKQVTPAAVEMTTARWSRVRSLTLACMRDMGCDTEPGRDAAGHSPRWKALAARLPTKARRLSMSRFMSFCTRLGVEPDQVTPATFEEFESALSKRSLCAKPERIFRATVKNWNSARAEVCDWPQMEIPLERNARFYSL
eukprot:gene61152-81524_t